MRIPDQIIILDISWRIVFKKRIGNGGIMGQCDPGKHEIHILKGLNEYNLVSTLIHEVLHAIEFGLQESIGHPRINKLEPPLASLFQQLIRANRGK